MITKHSTIKRIENIFFGNKSNNVSIRKTKRKSKQKEQKLDNIQMKSSSNTLKNKHINDDKKNNIYSDNYLAKEQNEEECIII